MLRSRRYFLTIPCKYQKNSYFCIEVKAIYFYLNCLKKVCAICV